MISIMALFRLIQIIAWHPHEAATLVAFRVPKREFSRGSPWKTSSVDAKETLNHLICLGKSAH